jgi:hypothetical protein
VPVLAGVAEQAQLGVDQAAGALGVAQRQAAPDGPDVVGAQLAVRVGGLALDRQPAAGERAADALQLGRALREAHAPLQPLDAVREAAHAQAGPVELQGAGQARGRRRAGDVDCEPGVAAAPQPPGEE